MLISWLTVLTVSVLYGNANAGVIQPSNTTAVPGVKYYPTEGVTYELASGLYRLTYFDPVNSPTWRNVIPALSLKVAIDEFQEDVAAEIEMRGKGYRVHDRREYEKVGVRVMAYVPSTIAYRSVPTLEDINNLFDGLLEAYHGKRLDHVARIKAQKLKDGLWCNIWTILLYYFPNSPADIAGNGTTVWS